MTSFTVNGQPVHYRMDPATPLLWALRDASNLTGTKFGCGTGHCGACMVHVDGNAVRSCRVPIGQLEGSFVTTIEGLSRDRSHPVQQAFAADMVVAVRLLHPGRDHGRRGPGRPQRQPDRRADRRRHPQLCRCGIYPRLRESIRRAARIKTGREQVEGRAAAGVDPGEAARAVPSLRAEPRARAAAAALISYDCFPRGSATAHPMLHGSPTPGACAAGKIRSDFDAQGIDDGLILAATVLTPVAAEAQRGARGDRGPRAERAAATHEQRQSAPSSVRQRQEQREAAAAGPGAAAGAAAAAGRQQRADRRRAARARRCATAMAATAATATGAATMTAMPAAQPRPQRRRQCGNGAAATTTGQHLSAGLAGQSQRSRACAAIRRLERRNQQRYGNNDRRERLARRPQRPRLARRPRRPAQTGTELAQRPPLRLAAAGATRTATSSAPGAIIRPTGTGATAGSRSASSWSRLFYSQRYWIGDPWQYRLPPAYPGTQWVRYYNDVLLVDVYTGEVIDVIHGFFW